MYGPSYRGYCIITKKYIAKSVILSKRNSFYESVLTLERGIELFLMEMKWMYSTEPCLTFKVL